jgi:hypothetical protein
LKQKQYDVINALEDAIFAGDVKTVVVWKLDRVARSLKEGINHGAIRACVWWL